MTTCAIVATMLGSLLLLTWLAIVVFVVRALRHHDYEPGRPI